MARYDAKTALPGGEPGPWGESVEIRYDVRDVLLYAVGIGARDLRFVFEGHPDFAVFPTFPIRWSGAGAPIDRSLIPPSPGPLDIDAERYIETLRPLPTSGTVKVTSRLIGVHPRSKGAGFVETESLVTDANGEVLAQMVNGSFRRGVERLGDIEPFEGAGQTFFAAIAPPQRPPDHEATIRIAENQAHMYRLSGDYNPLHIDPAAAKFGGFGAPILHGLCTFGICARMLIEMLCEHDPRRFKRLKVRFSSPVFPGDLLKVTAWRDRSGRVIIAASAKGKTVVSNAYFEYR